MHFPYALLQSAEFLKSITPRTFLSLSNDLFKGLYSFFFLLNFFKKRLFLPLDSLSDQYLTPHDKATIYQEFVSSKASNLFNFCLIYLKYVS